MALTQDQINRYSRHLLLPEVGVEGQEKICNKHFVMVASWSDTLVLLDFTQKGRHGVQAGMCRPF